MFQISVESEFCAAHALVIRGLREPTHGHNFKLTVTLEGPTLDPDGLLLDFHAVERLVHEVTRPLNNSDLNTLPAFGQQSPSAEHIARFIADRITAGLPAIVPAGPNRPRLAAVRVTEAPGCSVTYQPSRTTYSDPPTGR